MALPNNDPNKEIAQALVAIVETQDAMIRMLWSIKSGLPSLSSLDDSDFKNTDARRKIAINALRTKYGCVPLDLRRIGHGLR